MTKTILDAMFAGYSRESLIFVFSNPPHTCWYIVTSHTGNGIFKDGPGIRICMRCLDGKFEDGVKVLLDLLQKPTGINAEILGWIDSRYTRGLRCGNILSPVT